ncbi:MAG TPA: DUF4920 domain-containing protein [Pyrinomonadaceae bacterium]|jgi:Ni/Co efflux regulator RcnB
MKKIFVSTFLVAALSATTALTAAAQEAQHKHDASHKHGAQKHDKDKPTDKDKQDVSRQQTDMSGDPIIRGAAIGTSPSVKFADVLKEPQKYAGKQVVVEGVVERVCQKQGCWMELAPEKGAAGVRVTFKDHGFFVPFKSSGYRARAEGEFSVNVLSKEDADHYESDGAKIKRNDDGTANEITFLATGVELRK